MMQGAHISQEDLILFAMQALSEGESAAVHAHLKHCDTCPTELAQINGDLALVAMSVEQHAVPKGARERFMNRIEAAPNEEQELIGTPVVAIDTIRTSNGTSVWIPWMAVAAMLLVSILMGWHIRTLNEELRRQSDVLATEAAANSHAQEVLQLLTAPAAKRVTLITSKAKPVPTARAVYLAESGGLILQANDLEQLAAGTTYELWVIPANGQAPIPAGLFKPDAAGSASVVLPPLPKGVPAKAFGVTVEKAEGSAAPTAPILLSGAVSASGE